MQFSKKFQSKNKWFFNLLLLIYVKFNCFILVKSPNTVVDFDFGVYSCLHCQTPNIYKSASKNDTFESLDEITKLNKARLTASIYCVLKNHTHIMCYRSGKLKWSTKSAILYIKRTTIQRAIYKSKL